MTDTYSATYDAWNRLVEIKDGANVVLKCEYDGLGRRTKKLVNTSDPLDQTYDSYLHFYYNSGWQILETRETAAEAAHPESLDVEMQYVWSRRYIDAPVLRDRDADSDSETGDLGVTDSGLDERLYYTTDANMNATALIGTDGSALERYVYDPYGQVTIYDDDWSDTRSSSSYDNAILYCGYYHDWQTGLYHVRHRPYHPTLGRWLQRDPIGYADGMGLYEYVGASPLGRQDPSGLTRFYGRYDLWEADPGDDDLVLRFWMWADVERQGDYFVVNGEAGYDHHETMGGGRGHFDYADTDLDHWDLVCQNDCPGVRLVWTGKAEETEDMSDIGAIVGGLELLAGPIGVFGPITGYALGKIGWPELKADFKVTLVVCATPDRDTIKYQVRGTHRVNHDEIYWAWPFGGGPMAREKGS